MNEESRKEVAEAYQAYLDELGVVIDAKDDPKKGGKKGKKDPKKETKQTKKEGKKKEGKGRSQATWTLVSRLNNGELIPGLATFPRANRQSSKSGSKARARSSMKTSWALTFRDETLMISQMAFSMKWSARVAFQGSTPKISNQSSRSKSSSPR